jgi:hypothetical protein
MFRTFKSLDNEIDLRTGLRIQEKFVSLLVGWNENRGFNSRPDADITVGHNGSGMYFLTTT